MDENTKEKRGSLYFAYPAYVNLANSLILLHDNAIVDVHYFVYMCYNHVYFESVGFSIAYLQQEGNARAYISGISKVQTPALFFCVFIHFG